MPVLVFLLDMKLLVQAECIPDLGFPVTKADGVQKPCQWEEWMEVLINYSSFFKVDINCYYSVCYFTGLEVEPKILCMLGKKSKCLIKKN